ncbi:MAG: sensor histidine kinase [Kofleriaceae bacterium]
MHALLRRQVRKAFGDAPRSAELEKLLALVDEAYTAADADRAMLEHTLTLASDELYVQNRRLERELDDRKRLELELRHAEKLRAVGQLAAGVAHEINTPVQFVGDSLSFLDDAFREIESLLGSVEKLEGARERFATSDIAYLREEIPAALARCRNGTGRVATIVRALKTLAHPDQVEQQVALLDEAIHNTLVVAASEIKFVADVELDLAPDVRVVCHVGEIQQVLINLIVNAAHAIADHHRPAGTRGTIRIATRVEGRMVKLSISDDGAGIPEAIRHRIFEPFFTTKPVGTGTGQGLSLVHSMIVDHHGGQIGFESQLGVGTTFTITLPLDGRAAQGALAKAS